MASPQLEDGYTKISNEILEALSRMKISEHEVRILFFLIRKTYGWRKKADWISLSQFSKGCGIDRRNAHKAIKRLLSKNLVVICRDDIKHPTYGFQKDYEKWVSYVGMTDLADKNRERRKKESVRTYDRVVYLRTLTKETNTKETLRKKEERETQPPPSSESQNPKTETLISSFKEKAKPNPKDPACLHKWLLRAQSAYLKEHGEKALQEFDWNEYVRKYYPGAKDGIY